MSWNLRPGQIGVAEDSRFRKAVISLAHILNLRVIAEGVEDEQQHAFLKENACDEVQGYFFGKPMAVEDFTAWMSRQAQSGQACK